MTPSSFTCALHATHRRRQPGSMMMIAVRGRRCGTGRAGPATGLDQPSSAGVTAALPGCGRDMDVMYPARCDCAQLADRGAAELYHFEAAEWRSHDMCGTRLEKKKNLLMSRGFPLPCSSSRNLLTARGPDVSSTVGGFRCTSPHSILGR